MCYTCQSWSVVESSSFLIHHPPTATLLRWLKVTRVDSHRTFQRTWSIWIKHHWKRTYQHIVNRCQERSKRIWMICQLSKNEVVLDTLLEWIQSYMHSCELTIADDYRPHIGPLIGDISKSATSPGPWSQCCSMRRIDSEESSDGTDSVLASVAESWACKGPSCYTNSMNMEYSWLLWVAVFRII